jgi:hypothetical protein
MSRGLSLVASDDQLLSAGAYVLDDPVRAGLCGVREDWPWLGGEFVADLRER